METLREEVSAKLRHILHDIKDLQKTIINLGLRGTLPIFLLMKIWEVSPYAPICPICPICHKGNSSPSFLRNKSCPAPLSLP